jgi:hypothetical protein
MDPKSIRAQRVLRVNVLLIALLALTVLARTSFANNNPSDEIFYAKDFNPPPPAPPTPTNGIQEAINACQAGYGTKGCIVRLPRGDSQIKTTITIGGFSGNAKEGVVLQGYGAGEWSNVNFATGGSNLLWAGTSSAPMIDAQATNKLRIQDATLVMDAGLGSVASDGVRIEGLNPSYPTTGALLENLWIQGTSGTQPPQGTKGIRLYDAGQQYADQIDLVHIRNVHMSSVSTCVEIDSNQSQVNDIDGLNCGYTQFGVNLVAGASTIENSFFGSARTLAAAAIQINVKGTSPPAESLTTPILNNFFEIWSGNAILGTTDGSVHQYGTTVIGNNFNAENPGLTMIDYRVAPSPISLIGNTVVTNATTFSFDSTIAGTQWTGRVFAVGNQGPITWSAGSTGNGTNTVLTCINSTLALGPFIDLNCNNVADVGEGGINTSSNSTSWGFMMWAAAGTSPNTACANRNLSCVKAYPASGGHGSQNLCASTAADYNVFCR